MSGSATDVRESTALDRPSAEEAAAHAVAWHDPECGAYRADVPLWLSLARRLDGPVLDVGAGTGRVSLELARAGYEITAVDRDAALLAALGKRAAGLAVETVGADARSLALARRDYALCVMPMQTIQLLGGADGRAAFLRGARERVRAGGLVACAILGELEPFDCRDGQIGPPAERARIGEREYVSRALRVVESRRTVTIERERRIVGGADVELSRERDVIELDRLSAARLEHEARAVGLRPEPVLAIPATDEHVASTVVMLGV